jgi:serine/threonine protein kinase
MAELLNANNETSCFLTDKFEGIEKKFTNLQELHSQGYTLLLRAKRYGRWYVLKTLTEDVLGQSVYAQVLRKEFDVLIQLQHPHVLQTLGMEDVEGVGPSIVMEYIDGDTLATLLERSDRLTLEQRRRIADELCDALAYIHSLGIVHRDLKPENIMITRNGSRVKLIDFGMADTDQHAVLKQPAGTLNYMSPEQAQQSVPDVRNDIYSLGLVMRDLQLGRCYKKVIDRCLSPIKQRYQNMNEVIAAIERVRHLRREWFRYGVAAVLALLVVIVVAQSWRFHTMDRQLNKMETGKQQALEALSREMNATQLEEHIDTLSRWDYRWPDLNTRLMDVCKFIYAYTDALPSSYSQYDRDQIAEAMLSRYGQWNDQIVDRLVAIKRMEE